MVCVVTVSYPAAPDATFDIDYYLKHHMPLVQRKWQRYGLTDWPVRKLDNGARYSYEAIMYWASADQVKEAVAKDSVEIMRDIPNFCNKAPVQMIGSVVASASEASARL